MKKLSNGNRRFSALNIMLLVQLILMFSLSIGITQLISMKTTQSSDDYMTTIADERSRIILSYVDEVERTLREYSHSGEIINAVSNPKDNAATEAAQKYTEEFSKEIPNLEGIYVSEWNTHVLAHTQKQTAGLTTRTGKPLKQLQEALISAGDGVYDTGIISSPASGRQIVSMYKAVYNQAGEPAGLVGIGVYTEGLVSVLDSPGRSNMKNSFYTMINTSDRRYIFNRDVNKITAETDVAELRALCDSLRGVTEDRTGKFTYSVEGRNYVSVYSYIAERGWIFMIDDTESEIYNLTRSMKIYLVVFCVFCFILIVLFNVLNKRHEETAADLSDAVEKQVKTKESLANAVYYDFLTDVKNRVSFANDFEDGKITVPQDSAYYFAMFNIRNFSSVNIVYGEEAGDMILVSVAKLLNKHFPEAEVYRTGSDEFVAVQKLPRGAMGYSAFLNSVNRSLAGFAIPFDVGAAKVNISVFAVAACRKSSVNLSVLPALKNIMNMNMQGAPVPVSITDLDIMNV